MRKHRQMFFYMNSMYLKLVTPITLFVFLMSVSSCTKETLVAPTAKSNTVEQVNNALYSSAHGIEVMRYILTQANSHKNNDEATPLFPNPCTQVVTEDIGGGKMMATLDFGTIGCADVNGVTYSGKVTVTYNSDDISSPNTEFKVQYYNFAIGNISQEGKLIMKNLGIGTNGIPRGSVKSSTYITNLSTTTTYFQSMDIMVENPGYENWITGSITIKNSPSATPNVIYTVAEKLVQPYTTCSNTVSGVVDTQRPGQPTESLDYGDGTCDDLGILTINGVASVVNVTD